MSRVKGDVSVPFGVWPRLRVEAGDVEQIHV